MDHERGVAAVGGRPPLRRADEGDFRHLAQGPHRAAAHARGERRRGARGRALLAALGRILAFGARPRAGAGDQRHRARGHEAAAPYAMTPVLPVTLATVATSSEGSTGLAM